MDNTYPVLHLGSSAGEQSSTLPSSHGSAKAKDRVNVVTNVGGGINFMGTTDRNDEVNVDAKQKNKNKKQRYAFQTKSQVGILDDGYRWRKYGQKAVKYNSYPRNYYKCTHQGCDVKKQVQRLDKDETIVVTTYQGVHTHSTEKSSDNFQQILNEMKIFPPY